jgi:primosomal protein N' (replication factor Y) (superfamily II helicase)
VDLFQETGPARVKEKRIRCLSLTGEGKKMLAAVNPLAEIRLATRILIKSLADRGWLDIRELLWQRRSWQKEWHGRIQQVERTSEQSQVVESVRQAMADGFREPLLLYGVTGSGKTEVCVHLIRGVLAGGGQALVLVPEIGLTPAALHIYRAHFGPQVAILHSGLSEVERHDKWWRVRRGERHLVGGTRSPVFAPLEHLQLIIIDEEHGASYKQEESPRYHARDFAAWRARHQTAVLLLGSAPVRFRRERK